MGYIMTFVGGMGAGIILLLLWACLAVSGRDDEED